MITVYLLNISHKQFLTLFLTQILCILLLSKFHLLSWACGMGGLHKGEYGRSVFLNCQLRCKGYLLTIGWSIYVGCLECGTSDLLIDLCFLFFACITGNFERRNKLS